VCDDFGDWARSYHEESANGDVDDGRVTQNCIAEIVSKGAMEQAFETSRDDRQLGTGQALEKANEGVHVHRTFHFSTSLFLWLSDPAS